MSQNWGDGGGWGQGGGYPPGGAPPGGGFGQPPGGYGPPGGGGYGPPGGGGYGPPPGGFGGGNYGPPPGFGPQGGPRAVQERSSVLVLVLAIVTCGIYGLYWIYKTSDELQQQTGDTSIKPGLDLLLTVVTCGLWGIYVEYRNVQKVHACLVATNPHHKDQSQTVLILNIASLFVGVTGLVALYMVQEELNQLARGGSR